MSEPVHASSQNNAEYTLCGLAFDLGDVDDGEVDPIFAQRGDLITCEQCREIITYAKTIKRWRQS